MKICFLTLFMAAALVARPQADSGKLKENMFQLQKAILDKDAATLDRLLHEDLTFGHSSGMTQTKKELISDLESGKMIYNKIESSSTRIAAMNKQWASVKVGMHAEGTANGAAFNLNLSVLEVWIPSGDGWKLIARQSTKVN